MAPPPAVSSNAEGRATPGYFLASHEDSGASSADAWTARLPKISAPLRGISEISQGVPNGLLGRSPADSRRYPDLGQGGACRRAVFCDEFAIFLWFEQYKFGLITRRNKAAANFSLFGKFRMLQLVLPRSNQVFALQEPSFLLANLS